MTNYSTQTPALARRLRSTAYGLALVIGEAHGFTPWRVLDMVMWRADGIDAGHGLTLTSGS